MASSKDELDIPLVSPHCMLEFFITSTWLEHHVRWTGEERHLPFAIQIAAKRIVKGLPEVAKALSSTPYIP